eukprot:m.96366 g.96366  ORF g.96366 m.96366 type:complete len:952 (+) comp15050_c0_seq1:34-2889(+)
MSTGVKVCCRFRPQLPNELSKGGVPIVSVDSGGTTCVINGAKRATFTFDRVFGGDSTQEGVYEYTAKPIVEDVLKGYNGTIFAYGQTSSGKTHTMEGPDVDGDSRGIIPRIVFNIFSYIDMAPESLEFTVRVSYFEIYMEKIRDLLCDGNVNLQIHENRERGVYVRHATELYMQDPEDVMEVMRAGSERRSVASTNMNDISSRSHSVFLMEITQKDTLKGGVKTGKLFLVDLAGSEKVSKTGADGMVLDEAKNINKSLSALGLVIMNLTEGASRNHIPYRDSKLTRILQESLGGNARTTIIICASPSSYNEQETISTLRFGQRAKKIKNKARVNIQYSAEELQRQLDQAKKEITKLAKRLASAEAELEVWRGGGTVSEADRAELGSKARLSLTDDDGAGTGGGDPNGATAEETAILEQQKEELLARESELLDMLDEKDEHIHELETELESTGQDKVTITQLAAENAQLRENLKESEEREEELAAENGEFEAAIEEMAEVNTQCQIELEELMESNDAVDAKLTEQRALYAGLSQKVAENLVAMTSDASSALQETGVAPCDAQLARLQQTMLQLQQDTSRLKELEEQTTTELSSLKSAGQETSKQVAELRTTNNQLQEKNKALGDAKAELEAEMTELKAKYERSRQEFQEQMGKLLENQESSSAAKESEAIRSALESDRERQQSEHQLEVQGLREKINALDAEMEQVKAQLDAKDVELQGALATLEAQKAQLAEKEVKLSSLSENVTKKEELTRKAKTVEQGATKTLAAFDQFKSQRMSAIREQMKSQLAAVKIPTGLVPNAGATPSSAHDARVHSLQEANEKLKADLKETNAALKQARADLTAQMRASEQRKGRIARLEKQFEEAQRKLQAKLEHIQQSAHRKSQPTRIAKKEAATVTRRGGSRVLNAQDKQGQQFWKSNTSGVAGQGQPMVGNYAQATETAAEALTTPEFV